MWTQAVVRTGGLRTPTPPPKSTTRLATHDNVGQAVLSLLARKRLLAGLAGGSCLGRSIPHRTAACCVWGCVWVGGFEVSSPRATAHDARGHEGTAPGEVDNIWAPPPPAATFHDRCPNEPPASEGVGVWGAPRFGAGDGSSRVVGRPDGDERLFPSLGRCGAGPRCPCDHSTAFGRGACRENGFFFARSAKPSGGSVSVVRRPSFNSMRGMGRDFGGAELGVGGRNWWVKRDIESIDRLTRQSSVVAWVGCWW